MTMLTITALFSPSVTAINRVPMTGMQRHDGAVTSLDGRWDFLLVDRPEDAPAGWFEVGHDLDGWRHIDVPGVWTRQGTGDLPHYTNVVMPWPGRPPNVPERNPTGLYRSRSTGRPESGSSSSSEPPSRCSSSGATAGSSVWGRTAACRRPST